MERRWRGDGKEAGGGLLRTSGLLGLVKVELPPGLDLVQGAYLQARNGVRKLDVVEHDGFGRGTRGHVAAEAGLKAWIGRTIGSQAPISIGKVGTGGVHGHITRTVWGSYRAGKFV